MSASLATGVGQLAAVLLTFVLPHPAGPPVDQRAVAAAVRGLGAAAYADRERAEDILRGLGVAAESALRAAVAGPDPEVSRRAGGLLDRLALGVPADATPAVAEQVRKYHAVDRWQRVPVVEALMRLDRPGRRAALTLACRERDPGVVAQIAGPLFSPTYRLGEEAVGAGRADDIGTVLAVALAAGWEHAPIHVIAWHVALETAAAEAARLAAKTTLNPAEAEVFARLELASGDTARAVAAAARLTPERRRELYLSAGHWAGLTAQAAGWAGVEEIGYRLTACRLTGDAAGADRAANELKRTKEEPWFTIKGLLLNDRVAEAAAVSRKWTSFSARLHALRLDYTAALAVEAGPDPKDRLAVAALRAVMLERLGRPEAKAALAAVRAMPEHTRSEYGSPLIDAQARAGQTLAALESLAGVVSSGGRRHVYLRDLWVLFDDDDRFAVGAAVVEAWRHAHPDTDLLPGLRLARRACGRPSVRPLDPALAAVVDAALRLPPPPARSGVFSRLADMCEWAGDLDRADRCHASACQADTTSTAATAYGAFLLRAGRPLHAAIRLAAGDTTDAVYLHGLALTRLGLIDLGRDRQRSARLMPLGNEDIRFRLATAMAGQGDSEAAEAECRSIEWGRGLVATGHTFQPLWLRSELAERRGDWAAAADARQKALLVINRTNTGFVHAEEYLEYTADVHRLRGLARLAAGRPVEAAAEADCALAVSPGCENVGVLVRGLDGCGRADLGERVFDRAVGAHLAVADRYPTAAWHLAAAARIGVACGRLDRRLTRAAERAVALAPDDPSCLAALAEVRAATGDRPAAVRFAERAVAADPDDSTHRARLNRLTGGDR